MQFNYIKIYKSKSKYDGGIEVHDVYGQQDVGSGSWHEEITSSHRGDLSDTALGAAAHREQKCQAAGGAQVSVPGFANQYQGRQDTAVGGSVAVEGASAGAAEWWCDTSDLD